MINKTLFILIIVLLVFAIVDLLYEVEGSYFLISSLTIAEVMALIMMMINGTFMDRSYYKLTYIIVFFILFGVVLKILHLTGADQILYLSLPLLPVTYVIHFIAKKNKTILDALKFTTVLLYPITSIFVLAHYSSENNYCIISILHYFFWFTFLVFIVEGVKRKKIFNTRKEITED